MSVWMILLLILFLLALLYGFCLLPHLPRRTLGPLTQVYYAHRGLWDAECPENSLGAFQRAAAQGFGIEWDVHITRDGALVIHHDSSLKRMCGVDKVIEDCTLAELRALRLLGTSASIPTLEEALQAAGGVPLIVELKAERSVVPLCEAVYRQMQHYNGPWCVESFQPQAMRWFRVHAPEVLRGQLAYGLHGRKPRGRDLLIATLLQNALSRPDFLAYEAASDTPGNLPFRLARRLGHTLVAWTVRSQAQLDALYPRYSMLIFERFVPDCVGPDGENAAHGE